MGGDASAIEWQNGLKDWTFSEARDRAHGMTGEAKMAVIADWFENMAGDEMIEAAVIGPHDRDFFKEEGHHPFNDAPLNKVLSWDEARPFLSYEYDNGYGGADCHPVFAWTATKILTITEYDGSTGPAWFPRNPVDIQPGFDGVK